ERLQAVAGKTATTAYRRAGTSPGYRWPGSARGGVSIITTAAARVRVFAPVRGRANRFDAGGQGSSNGAARFSRFAKRRSEVIKIGDPARLRSARPRRSEPRSVL